ncbi:complement receptor type 2-like isoform X1 [Acipenser oxyrinchus oxyrinchus]|uniref:Complement receptor type 2-like isoform X1 n=1 Tax=Acipenser oxyrinchus oxyrinchus TaxID=40147 RepID=A0AAD8CGM8_ACIOX|nr:complement receptor type 2-like isoform X1 [Acipenser oxyrinchus oxyrinchus]
MLQLFNGNLFDHYLFVITDHKGCPLVHVENGYKTAGFGPVYNYGDFIAFVCNRGYILHGTDTVTCGINEIWEPELPTCQKGVKRTLWNRIKDAVKESVSEAIHWFRGLA